MKVFIVLILLLNVYYSKSQSLGKCGCPIKKGTIVIIESKMEQSRKTGVIIEGKKKKVFSVSTGIVKAIDIIQNHYSIYINDLVYWYVYENIKSIHVVLGQEVQKKEFIGTLDESQMLFFSMSKNAESLDPDKYLKCKIVHQLIR